MTLLAVVACPQAQPGDQTARSPQGDKDNAKQPNSAGASARPQSGQDDDSVGVLSLPGGTAPKGAAFVWLKTSDAYNVAAWYYAPGAPKVKGEPAPAILLLHMRGKDKSSWGGMADKLVEEGYAVIAIDLRGHGESRDPNGHSIALSALQDQDYQNMLFDVAAAHEYIARQRGVDSERLGIIGASIGANLGLLYCARDRRVRTVVALSPGLDYRSLRPVEAMEGVDKRAVYLVASRKDLGSATACETLSKSGHPDGVRSVRLFDGSAHGTDLFAAQPGFDDTIVGGWLLNTIPPKR
jgi:dienelactone hydrolase